MNIIHILFGALSHLVERFRHFDILLIDRLCMLKANLLVVFFEHVLHIWLDLIIRVILKLVRSEVFIQLVLNIFGLLQIQKEPTDLLIDSITNHSLLLGVSLLSLRLRLIRVIITLASAAFFHISRVIVQRHLLLTILVQIKKNEVLNELLLPSSELDSAQPGSLHVELSGLGEVFHELDELVLVQTEGD